MMGVGGACLRGVLGTDDREFRFYPREVAHFSVSTGVVAGSSRNRQYTKTIRWMRNAVYTAIPDAKQG
jgi:hypothetical protein